MIVHDKEWYENKENRKEICELFFNIVSEKNAEQMHCVNLLDFVDRIINKFNLCGIDWFKVLPNGNILIQNEFVSGYLNQNRY